MKKSIIIILVCLTVYAFAEQKDILGYAVEHPVHGAGDTLYDGPAYTVTPTAPPAKPRMCAEWEPATALLIRYPLGLPWTMIETAAEEVDIVCIVSSYYLSSAQSDFTSHSISNVQFVTAPTNTYWMRDWGPWCVFDSTGSFGISDHVYNRADTHGREDDDQANWTLASDLSINLWKSELRHTGGNFMTDGHGTGMSGDDVYDFTFNYSVGADSVDALMEAYWGIDNYITFEDPLSSYIDHIDCYAKFLNEETIIMVENGTSDDTALDALETYLESLDNCYGRKYVVYRINAPANHDAAYANSIILNGRVFVPITGYTNEDSSAIALYEQLMPGYEIIGIENPGGSIEFLPTDAIHCRSKALYDKDMLYIDHAPLDDQTSAVDSYTVNVNIISYADNALIPDSLKIYYRSNSLRDSAWSYVFMHEDSNDWYSGSIPPQSDSSRVDYYVTATDVSMKRECDPYPAPLGYYSFSVFDNTSMINEHFEVSDDTELLTTLIRFSERTLYLENSNMEMIKYSIFNAAGMRIDCHATERGSTISIDISDLRNGVYFIQYGTVNSIKTEQFNIVR